MPRTRVIRRAASLLAAVALLALTGCGSQDSSTPGAPTTKSGASTGDSKVSGDSASYPTQSKKACDVLTEAIAKKLLGTVAPATAPPAGTSSGDVSVTTCARTNSVTGAQAESASLLMRVAKTETGALSNEAVFDSPPAGAQDVSGYGEKAFWNPQYGQLNILNHGNWYILSIGPIDPRKHHLAVATRFAAAIKDQL
jgi:hypothetical protein